MVSRTSGRRVWLVGLQVTTVSTVPCGRSAVASLEGVGSFTLRLHCRWKHMSRLVFFCCVRTTGQWSLRTRLGVHYMEYQCTHRTVLVFLAGLTPHLSPITLHSCILCTPSPCTSPSHVQEIYSSEQLKSRLTSEVCVLYVIACM